MKKGVNPRVGLCPSPPFVVRRIMPLRVYAALTAAATLLIAAEEVFATRKATEMSRRRDFVTVLVSYENFRVEKSIPNIR